MKLSLTKIIALHLLPGLVITLIFVVIAPWTTRQNLPTPLALLFTWLLAAIPLELGILVWQGYRLNRRLSLEGVILFRETMNPRTLLWLTPLLLSWALIALTLLTPLANRLMLLLFAWFPEHLLLSAFAQNISNYPRPVLWLVVSLSGVLNVLVPVVEEVYFRGFLLPRITSVNKWAPLLNTVLFSLYHFWLPWEFFSRIIALLPMTYAVWWKRNVFIGIWVHVLLNSLGTIGLLVLILSQ